MAELFYHVIELQPLACMKEAAHATDYRAGSGLKVLRLVNKQVCAAMIRAVKGYTLVIDGVSEDLPENNMLKLTQLSRLCLHAKAGEKRLMNLYLSQHA